MALTLVVAFHLFGNGRVSGGVDVFLVISGYLFTGSIARRLARGDRVSLTTQYSRTFGRLLPAALTVLIFVAVAATVLLPASRLQGVARETRASALYYENWELISSSLSYGAAGADASPLQHFWSLSVQGQFFILWPPLLILVFWIARKMTVRGHSLLLPLMIVLTTLSFGYATWMVNADQSVAYFHSLTRFWELGLGGVFALTSHKLRISDRLKPLSMWLGFGLVATCGFFVNGKDLFPGPWALWPALGILLVILGSGAPTRFGLSRFLELPPIKFLADISYPMYLWHWPLLVFYLYYRDYDRLGWRSAAGLLVLSIVLSWLTRLLFEKPVLHMLPRLAPRAALIGILTILAVTGGTAATAVTKIEASQARELAALAKVSPDHPGAAVLSGEPDTTKWEAPIRPSAVSAERDLSDIYTQGCVQRGRDAEEYGEVLICEDDTKNKPRRRVVMSGGSHVIQWYPAMKVIADQENWELIVIDKNNCRLTSDSSAIRTSAACEGWNEQAPDVIIDKAPDAVITVGTETPAKAENQEKFYPGQGDAWRHLIDADIPVVAIRDTPRFLSSVPECLQENPTEPSNCARQRDEIFLSTSPVLTAAGAPEGVTHIDMTDSLCTDVCRPIVGNVLVYRDQDHMTATYARTTAPALREKLRAQVPSLF